MNQENNKVIAEFMDLPYKITIGQEYYNRKNIDNTGTWYNVKGLKYHTSYDWLMPVWLKVREIIQPHLPKDPWQNHFNAISYAIIHYDINIVCDRICRFIKFNNQQPQ